MIDVVIIGAGLTGLTTALYLKRAGAKVLLLEERSVAGGQIQSSSQRGYIYEKGPNTGVVSHPEVSELFRDLAAEELLQIADPNAKRRLIWKGDKFHALPSSLFSAVGTPLFTFSDKIRVLFEPFRKKGDNPEESLADLTSRRLGRSFLNYAVNPFISGIYAGDPEKLVTKYAMPKLYNLEQSYGSFVRGAMAKAREKKSDRDRLATKDVFSVKGGLSQLIERLVKEVGEDNIVLSAKGACVKQMDGFWQVSYDTGGVNHCLEARSVVTTIGAYRLFELLGDSIEELSRITSLKYAPIVQVSVGVRGQDRAKYMAFGGLVPSCEKRGVLGILFPSSCFQGRAPEGEQLLSLFLGGVNRADICQMSDEQIREIVFGELSAMLSVEQSDVVMTEIFRYPKAIPQYEREQGDRLEAIASVESRYRGLYLAGAIKDGIGMADRIKQGATLAAKILSELNINS